MGWLRLYVSVEGETERRFADDLLRPHLAQYSLEVRSRVVLTNRKLGKRGGIMDFAHIRNDLSRLMRQERGDDVRFTTMFDFYALPKEFPGWLEARRQALPRERVVTLEAALRTEMGDARLLPYVQLHELEALLYCDLSALRQRIGGSDSAIRALVEETAGLAPEEIDEGRDTAPSKRIIRHLPIYEKAKVRVGAPAAVAIGLEKLRAGCPHFDAWVRNLEALGEPLG